MRKYSVVGYHQLGRTQGCCGFIKEEAHRVVDLAGGRTTRWEEGDGVTVIPIKVFRESLGVLLLSPRVGKCIFPRKAFYSEMWLEVVKK